MAIADDVVAALARQRWRALVGYGYVLSGTMSEAEDLAQEALVRVVVRGRAGVTPHTVEAYVRRTMAMLYVDEGRRRTRFRRVRHLVAVRDDGSGRADLASDGVERTVIAEALAGLSPRERACVVLRHLDDLSVAETADVLGISTGAVKKYVSTAIDRLRQDLGPLAGLSTETTTVERTVER